MTNLEKIKAMTAEEIAELLVQAECATIPFSQGFCDLCDQVDCKPCILQWLEQEEKDDQILR